MRAFARLLIEHPKAIFVWSMGLTQHAHGVDTVRALMNVALARGLAGREYCGVMPIRGHSGVQGGAEVGCAPSFDSDTLDRWERVWGFPVPRQRGYTATEMIDANERQTVLVSVANERQSMPFNCEAGEDRDRDIFDVCRRVESSLDDPGELLAGPVRRPVTAKNGYPERDREDRDNQDAEHDLPCTRHVCVLMRFELVPVRCE